jgi:hypothetical protein
MGEVPMNVFGQPQKSAVRVPGSLSRVDGAWLVVDHLLRG